MTRENKWSHITVVEPEVDSELLVSFTLLYSKHQDLSVLPQMSFSKAFRLIWSISCALHIVLLCTFVSILSTNASSDEKKCMKKSS